MSSETIEHAANLNSRNLEDISEEIRSPPPVFTGDDQCAQTWYRELLDYIETQRKQWEGAF